MRHLATTIVVKDTDDGGEKEGGEEEVDEAGRGGGRLGEEEEEVFEDGGEKDGPARWAARRVAEAGEVGASEACDMGGEEGGGRRPPRARDARRSRVHEREGQGPI